jgi:hypothetical protein
MAFHQGPLDGHSRFCRSKPRNLHFSAKNQSERTRIAYPGGLLKLGRLQNFQVKYVSGSDAQAFGLRQAAARAAE